MTTPEKSLLETLSEEDIIAISKIIVSLSVKQGERFPFLNVDDCIQVSWKELIQYQSYYTPGKSKITTWVYKLVKDTLTSYAQKEYSKTQVWDDIENHIFSDTHSVIPDSDCSYKDLINVLKRVLSPNCFKYLELVEKDPKISFLELSKELGLPERDLVYLRDELRITTLHILGEK